MADKIFIDGMKFERPSPKCPEWIKGKISVKVDEFLTFAKKNENDRGYLNIDLKLSKDNNLYLELNTFKKAENEEKIN